jgi:hypothetical protein
MTEFARHIVNAQARLRAGKLNPMTGKANYPETLRLLRKYRSCPKEPLGQIFTRIAQELETKTGRSRRDDLHKMLNAWRFWGEMDNRLQSELLDCIEYTYLKPCGDAVGNAGKP